MPTDPTFCTSQLFAFAETSDARIVLVTELALTGASRELILIWDQMVKRGEAIVYRRELGEHQDDEIVIGVKDGATGILWAQIVPEGVRVLARGVAVN